MDTESLQPKNASTYWAREVLDHVTNHVEQERGLLEEYTKVAEGTESKALAYLVHILLEDERRHHRLFAELATSLKNAVDWSQVGPAVPAMDFHQSDRAAIRDVTNRLLQHEEADARELKRLHQELGNVKDTTLWGVLVEIMQRDTDKHIAILRFTQRHI